MRLSYRLCLLPSLLGVAFMVACSDDGTTPKRDGATTEAGGKLWGCSIPQEPCNAHDSCAIDPICGDDFLCRPRARQNCDDGLDCTTDSCGGKGLCINRPKEGFCAVLVKEGDALAEPTCVAAGTPDPKDPCSVCDPATDPERWSPRTGGRCDDDRPCTVDDTCKDGVCQGTFYGSKCVDGLDCTEDICDGKGGCKNKLKADTCIIGANCIAKDTRSPDGCSICDPTNKPNVWSPLPSVCKIGGQCFAVSERDPSGCGVCDPDKDNNDWSPTPNTCFIDGRCLSGGTADSSGCGVCDPTVDRDAFTLRSDRCKIGARCVNGDVQSPSSCGKCDPSQPDRWTAGSGVTQTAWTFESDLSGFSADVPVGGVGWQRDDNKARSGTHSLYYGNTGTMTFDSGEANSGSVKKTITLPAAQRAAVSFWVYLDVEDAEQSDLLSVMVDAKTVWRKGRQTIPSTLYRRWVFVEVDLSSYAGKTISLSFHFDSKDDWNNKGQGVFIDDVTLLTTCGAI